VQREREGERGRLIGPVTEAVFLTSIVSILPKVPYLPLISKTCVFYVCVRVRVRVRVRTRLCWCVCKCVLVTEYRRGEGGHCRHA